MPIGVGQGSTAEGGGTGTDRVLAATGGAETHTLLTAEMPSHDHDVDRPTASNLSGGTGLVGTVTHSSNVVTSTTTGGGGDHENMSPFLVVNFISKT